MALVFTHPDLLSLIAGYALSQTRDMIALNVVSKEFSVVTSLHSEAIFESDFRNRDPILQASLSSASGDGHPSWKERLQRIIELNNSATEQTLLRGYAHIDLVLHKHPSNGFQLRFGLVHDIVAVHSLRYVHGVVSAAETFLRPLGISAYADTASITERLSGGGLANMKIVLVSIDGSKVSDFSTFDSFFNEAICAAELSLFRFICVPQTQASELSFSLPDEVRLAIPLFEARVDELRQVRQGLVVTDDDDETDDEME